MVVAAEAGTTWPEAILILGIILAAVLLIGGATATFLEFRKDKRKGREIVTESEPAEPTGMSDLLEALQRSVEAARGGAKKGAATKRKKDAPKQKGGAQQKKSKRAEPDLSSASKSELLAMARELKVSGRSSMISRAISMRRYPHDAARPLSDRP